MTVLRFYRLSLFLPIVVPTPLLLALYVAPPLFKSIADWGLSMPLFVLAYSVVYGGIPYAALAMWAAWCFGDRSEAQIQRLVLALPLLMAGIAVLCFAAWAAANGVLNRASTLITVGAIASVVLGYGYVVVVLIARKFMTLTENPEPKFQV